MQTHENISARAGWRILDWCRAFPMSRSKFYTLPEPPKILRVGKMQIVTESPHEYAQRLAAEQAAQQQIAA